MQLQSNSPLPKQKTLLEQTLQQIQSRVVFFSTHNISAQNSLNATNNISVRSLSQIITPLKYFDINETPLNMNLATIYLNEQNKDSLKWAIQPPSEGEDSINEEEVFEPSFKWLVSAFVDPNLLQIDQPEPKKVQKGKVPEDWNNLTSLLITKVDKKIYLKSQIAQLEASIKKKFAERYSWLKFKRIKEIYYKGKPSLILKFGDSNSASFVYFSLSTYRSNRQEFGEGCEVFRIKRDDLKEYSKQKNWILLLFRHLPLSMTKDQLLAIINQDNCVKWLQDPLQICGAKYAICKVSYLDEALQICSIFNAKRIKDVKVNIHPKSSKNWKAQQTLIQQQQVLQPNICAQNEVIPSLDQSY